MAWKIDNVDLTTYGITVSSAEGVLDIPSIQDATHSWLDTNYSVATRDTLLPIEDRVIQLTCLIRSSSYFAFKNQFDAFITVIASPNKRQFTHPYSTTPIECFVADPIEVEKLVNWDDEIQVGRFILKLIVPGDKKYKYAPLYDGITGNAKGMLKMENGATYERVLMGVNEIKFSTESKTLINVKKNDYILFNGEKFVHFEDIQFTKYSTNKYVYHFKFEQETFKLRNIIIKNLDGFTEFYYYAIPISEIVDLIVSNAELRYPGLFIRGNILVSVTKNYHIKSETGYELLKRICDEDDVEFAFIKEGGHYKITIMERVNYPLVGNNGAVVFEYGESKGLYSIEREQQNKEDFCNILYVFGGTKNLPFEYTGLRLASTLNPIINQESVDLYGPIEKDVIFEECYPRGTRTVKNYIRIVGSTITMTTKTVGGITLTIPKKVSKPDEYIVIDDDIGFDINELLTKDPAKIVFNTGDLAGYEFVIKKYESASHQIYFNPIVNEKGVTLPNATFYPKAEDEYIIVNIQPPGAFTTEAISELNTLGTLHSQINSVVRNHYKVTVDPLYISNFYNIEGIYFTVIQIGNSVKIVDSDYEIADDYYRIVSMVTNIYSGEVNMILADIYHFKAQALLQKMKISMARMLKVQETLKMFDVEHKLKSTETVGDFKSELINPVDKYLNSDKIRPENIDPVHLAYDSGLPQFSIKDGMVIANVDNDPNKLTFNSGTFIHHSYYALDRVAIDKLKAAGIPYDPTRKWVIETTNITLPDNNGYFLYIKVPID